MENRLVSFDLILKLMDKTKELFKMYSEYVRETGYHITLSEYVEQRSLNDPNFYIYLFDLKDGEDMTDEQISMWPKFLNALEALN